MHPLLQRQIRRHLGDPADAPAGLRPFLDAVDEAYTQWQADIDLTQRSMELMSQELGERNRTLQEQLLTLSATEKALRESKSRLARASRIARIGHWLWDISTDSITCSDEIENMFGTRADSTRTTREHLLACVHPEDRETVQRALEHTLATGAPYILDHRILRPDGTVCFVHEQGELEHDAAGNPSHLFCIVHDISSRKQVEAALQREKAEQAALIKQLEEAHNQLLQSEKLASIGQLAAGVAHEINNPIGYVHSNLGTLEGYLADLFRILAACETARGTLRSDVPECRVLDELMRELDLPYLKEDIPALMRESKEGIERVRKIVQDLKDFSRLDASLDWHYADLRAGIDSTLNIVHNEIKYKADVVKEYGDIPEIECLPSQLNQVFMNLLVNAAQAIENSGGKRGTITVRTGRHGDKEVFVEVRDTGTGIPDQVRKRIFDPFFTTKPVGKGTGLGLSLAYGIIQKHHGRFELETTIGMGSTFRVILPVSQSPPSEDAKP